MKYRHTIVLEFDTPQTDRQYSTDMKAMGGNVVAVAFNDALEELAAVAAERDEWKAEATRLQGVEKAWKERGDKVRLAVCDRDKAIADLSPLLDTNAALMRERDTLREALAQREEELAAERRKNRELSSAIGRAREAAGDAAVTVCRVVDALPETTL